MKNGTVRMSSTGEQIFFSITILLLEITLWALGAWSILHHSLYSCREAYSLFSAVVIGGAFCWSLAGIMAAARTRTGCWGGLVFGFFFFWISVALLGGSIYRHHNVHALLAFGSNSSILYVPTKSPSESITTKVRNICP